MVAGAATVDVALPPGTPLGGYGGFPRRAWIPDLLGRHPYAFWFAPSTGVHDPIRVRALILESAKTRLLWLAADLVGIDPTLLSALEGRLSRQALDFSAIVLSASHTHSGPGAYANSALFAFLAIDRTSSAVRGQILEALERAASAAESSKAPAVVSSARVEVSDVAESRVQEALDPELGVLKVTRPDGRPVAMVWNYAIHGTALARDNFLLSGDLMGEASARVEREIGAPALFVNGALGDVSPRGRGWVGVKAIGDALAAGALRAWGATRPEPGRLEVARERVAMPPPTVAIRNCLGGWAPAWMTVGVSEALPSSAQVMAIAIGRTAWVAIPGELETSLGRDIKQSVPERFDRVFVAGVSNDYLGYFLAPAHYRRPSYIACGSLYGERGGEIVRDAAVAALKRLGPPGPSEPVRETPAPRAPRRPVKRGR
jgi:hypothetical protein